MSEQLKGALEAFLQEKTQANTLAITELRLLSGGAIQENWRVSAEVTGGQYAGLLDVVVRADAPSGVSVSHGRDQEFALLSQVFAAKVTVPEPLWLCTDLSVIGRPFFVMRRVNGIGTGHVVVKDQRYAPDRHGLVYRLGQELARIHSIEPPAKGLEFLPALTKSPALTEVARMRANLDALGADHPVLEWGLRWLELNAPETDRIVLCHGDFRTGNYMVDEQGLTAILDWEFAGWGDRLQDIGWFCARCWRFGRDDLEAGGVGQRADFYRGYESVAGNVLNRERVHYWEVLAHVNWAVIALQQAARQYQGEEDSLLLALTGHMVPGLEQIILQETEVAHA